MSLLLPLFFFTFPLLAWLLNPEMTFPSNVQCPTEIRVRPYFFSQWISLILFDIVCCSPWLVYSTGQTVIRLFDFSYYPSLPGTTIRYTGNGISTKFFCTSLIRCLGRKRGSGLWDWQFSLSPSFFFLLRNPSERPLTRWKGNSYTLLLR